MKARKLSVFAFIVCCMMVLLMGIGCSSTQANGNDLIYNKKYYHADYYTQSGAEKEERYIIFYKNGTGEFYGNGYGKSGAIKFKYFLGESSVHCFFDGGNEDAGTNWDDWYWVGEGFLYRETSSAIQYINEEYISKLPNFGS